MRGLIVEDHVTDLKNVSDELVRLGHTVKRAASAREALHASAAPVDFLVCDLALSRRRTVMEGMGLITEFRLLHPDCFIVAWSARRDYKVQAIEAGADIFVDKNEDRLPPKKSAKLSAFKVHVALIESSARRRNRRPFGWLLKWVGLPILAAISVMALLSAFRFHMPDALARMPVPIPPLLCCLFLATVSIRKGRKNPSVYRHVLFTAAAQARKELIIAIAAAIVLETFKDAVLNSWIALWDKARNFG